MSVRLQQATFFATTASRRSPILGPVESPHVDVKRRDRDSFRVLLPSSLGTQVRALAASEGEPVAAVVRRALRRLIAEHEFDQREREAGP